jgi:hypothetical protein
MQDRSHPDAILADGKPPLKGDAPFDTTIVLCVEAGALEQQAILLVQSIRNWGGRFASAPIFAVQPRIGPDLDRRTRAVFRASQVEYVKKFRPAHASWRGTLNKCKAMAYVERVCTTETITWLDTDMLVAAEPYGLALSPDEDFACCPCGGRYHSTTGPGDRNEAYWQTVCGQFRIDVDTLGWVTSWPDQDRIRTYWQGGVYCYRRASQLGAVHYETHCELMKSRISHNTSGVFHYDQTSLTIAVRRAGLRWRVLPYDHNLQINPIHSPDEFAPAAAIAAAKVLHYHGFMWPDTFPRFLEELRPAHAELCQLLERNGPLDKHRILPHRRVLAAVLKRYQKLRYRQFEKTCKIV